MHDRLGTAALLQCAACRAPLRVAAEFCSSCGNALNGASAPPPGPGRPASIPADQGAASVDTKVALQFRELRRVGWLFGVLLSSSLVLGFVSRFDASPWPDTIISAADAAVVLAFAIANLPAIAPLLGPPRGDVRTAVGLGLGSLGVALALCGYFAVLTAIGAPMAHFVRDYEQAHWPLWSVFVLVSVMPAVVEELAFRGVIQSSLERVGSGGEAWIIQAALFGVLHLSPIIFPSHFAMGLWFGWLRRRTQSLYPGMAMHALWNAAALISEL